MKFNFSALIAMHSTEHPWNSLAIVNLAQIAARQFGYPRTSPPHHKHLMLIHPRQAVATRI
ncbi:MAG: hypothetical protein OSA92_08310 [Pirellulaceae bacterium]|nr:hypothetical protein [Pirellulaceae bacterium]